MAMPSATPYAVMACSRLFVVLQGRSEVFNGGWIYVCNASEKYPFRQEA